MLDDAAKMKKIIDMPDQNTAIVEYFRRSTGSLSGPNHKTIYYEYDSEGNETVVQTLSTGMQEENAEEKAAMLAALGRSDQ